MSGFSSLFQMKPLLKVSCLYLTIVRWRCVYGRVVMADTTSFCSKVDGLQGATPDLLKRTAQCAPGGGEKKRMDVCTAK